MPHRFAKHIFILSGLFGIVIGYFLSSWQQSVAMGQVISGLVQYDATAINAVLFQKSWTFQGQLAASLLSIGFNEAQVSVFVSIIPSLLFSQGIALTVLAFSRSPLFSLLTTLFVLSIHPFWINQDYGIYVHSGFTYGQTGLGYGLLMVGLVSVGWYRSAALLLGFAPAVHVVIGTWFVGVGLTSFFIIRFWRWPLTLPHSMGRFFALGIVGVVLSLGIHLLNNSGDLPPGSVLDFNVWQAIFRLREYVHVSTLFTTKHLITLLQVPLLLPIWIMGIFYLLKKNRYPEAWIMLIMAIAAVGSSSLFLLHKFTGTLLPELFYRAMSNRLVNFNIVLGFPLLLGLLTTLGHRVLPNALIFMSASLLILIKAGFWNHSTQSLVIILFSVLWIILDYRSRSQGIDTFFSKMTLFKKPLFKSVVYTTPLWVVIGLFGVWSVFWREATQLLVVFMLSGFSLLFLAALLYKRLELANFIGWFMVTPVAGLVLIREWYRLFDGSSFLLFLFVFLIPALGLFFLIYQHTLTIQTKNDVDPHQSLTLFQTFLITAFPVTVFLFFYGLWSTWSSTLIFIPICGLSLFPMIRSLQNEETIPLPEQKKASFFLIGYALLCLVSGLFLVRDMKIYYTIEAPLAHPMQRPKDEVVFWEKVNATPGVLLTAGSFVIVEQIFSGRPILVFGGALNWWVINFPTHVPRLRTLVKEVYGLDIFDSSFQMNIDAKATWDVWETWDIKRWKTLSTNHTVKNVVTPVGWRLNLPVVARSRWHLLYEIPD